MNVPPAMEIEVAALKLFCVILQVSSIHAEWGAMLGNSIGTFQDLLDVYAWQLQLWEDHDVSVQRIKVCQRP